MCVLRSAESGCDCNSTVSPTTKFYSLSLHDALPIYLRQGSRSVHHVDLQNAGRRAEKGKRSQAGRMDRAARGRDRKSTRLNSSHLGISYADFCLKKKIHKN